VTEQARSEGRGRTETRCPTLERKNRHCLAVLTPGLITIGLPRYVKNDSVVGGFQVVSMTVPVRRANVELDIPVYQLTVRAREYRLLVVGATRVGRHATKDEIQSKLSHTLMVEGAVLPDSRHHPFVDR
jgi:hypothetical protein